ncbi:hypothetical protein B9T07_25915 [Limnospira fusiformis CCALA 023]|nr:hypothetical protein AP285_14170 [Arthrospira platensis YZ]KDR57537.1 hypothetical protein APPUASWS_010415 [Arthrospira platensis str. Paraca]BDT13343.1 hypothetical protein N39L_30660 [Arthrospira platensis NIES-39]
MSEAPLTLPLLMDSQKPAQLQQHLDAIAAILYSEANPTELTTLEANEKSVRALTQEHVLPQLGVFLSTRQQTATVENNSP